MGGCHAVGSDCAIIPMNNKNRIMRSGFSWAEVDSNHRSKLQQIYSLSPLATRESAHSISSCIILTEKYYSIAADCLQEISRMHASFLVATHNLEKFVFEFPELSRQSPKSRASTDLVSLLRANKKDSLERCHFRRRYFYYGV